MPYNSHVLAYYAHKFIVLGDTDWRKDFPHIAERK